MNANCYVTIKLPTEIDVATISSVETLGLFGSTTVIPSSSWTLDGTQNTIGFPECD